ncbi:hypothetical protein D3C73_662940 [compost metagenome]
MSLYTFAVAEEMKRRVYTVRASTDGGRTFNTYSSAGAFNKATGLTLYPHVRARHIAENGGIKMQLGDTTTTLRLELGGHDCLITFTRSK